MRQMEVPLKFWKFEYHGPIDLRKCIVEQKLPTSKEVLRLLNTYDHPAKSLRKGVGVIVAKLDGELVRIYAVGKVRNLASDSPVTIDCEIGVGFQFLARMHLNERTRLRRRVQQAND